MESDIKGQTLYQSLISVCVYEFTIMFKMHIFHKMHTYRVIIELAATTEPKKKYLNVRENVLNSL